MDERAVSLSFRLGREDLEDAEAGLAQALGMGPPRASLTPWLLGPLMALSKIRWVLDEEHVANRRRSWPWEAIGLTFETERAIHLVITETTGPITLPKRAMDAPTLATLRRLVADRVVATPEAMAHIRAVRTGSR